MKQQEEILKLAYDYVLSTANNKSYNIQSMAIISYFDNEKNQLKNNIDLYLKDYHQFSSKVEVFKVRDFIYKKDYFTPRDMYVVPPSNYLYYTFQVFRLCYEMFPNEVVDFSIKKNEIYYSGRLDFTSFEKNVNENSNFNYSYNQYQKKRKEFNDSKVLVMDIQDFFKGIKVRNLINKLNYENRFIKSEIMKKAIKNLADYFLEIGFTELPQLHYSIASSILSQIYLKNFSKKMQTLLAQKNLLSLRFVDDINIKLSDSISSNEINDILNRLSSYLWEDGINFNSSKTKILDKDEFKKITDTTIANYDGSSDYILVEKNKYISQKIIEDKVDELIANNGRELIEYFNDLNLIIREKGIDLEEYHKMKNRYISIDSDSSTKVLNSLIYGKKWKKISISNLEIILSNSVFVYFNPYQYTVFYILLNNHVEKITNKKFSYIRTLLNRLFTTEEFTFRECVISIAYLLQKKFKHTDLISNLNEVNDDYVQFIEKYISF